MRKISHAEFIEKAKAIHGSKWLYLTEYFGMRDPILIECKEHGAFKQLPMNHLKGQGCPVCRYRLSSEKLIKTTETFVKDAKDIHGEKYDYSLVEYSGAFKKVDIICKIHGIFKQTPSGHLSGKNCTICAKSKTNEEFIKEAKIIHNNEYSYVNSNYIRSDQKIDIICKIHGIFKQTPHNHLRGQGCSKCNNIGCYSTKFFGNGISVVSQYRRNRIAKLYLIELSGKNEKFYKIGITLGNRKFPAKYKKKYIAFKTGKLYDMFCLEQDILKKVLRYRPSEKLGGDTECFQATETELQNIVNIIKERLYDYC